MHFLLVQPPIGKRTVSVTPSLGLPYLAAILEKMGTRVDCVSCDAESLDADLTAKKVLDLQPDVIGFSLATLAINSSLDIVGQVKRGIKKNTIFIAGGPHATIFPDDILRAGFDFVVRGEGEKTMEDFVEFLLGKKKIEEIKGLSYWDGEQIHHNENQTLIADLDILPFPAWHLFPIDRYHSDFKKTNRCLPIMTSRGCPGQCVFCYKSLFGNCFRTRSPENIVKEIKHIKEKFKVKEFDILDDSFTFVPERAIKICKLITKEQINLPWGLPSGIRVDTVSRELLGALKEAGCYRIGFGVESGNDNILKLIKKNTTKNQIREAVKMAKDMGFITSCFFMIGNMRETESTINDTINFAKELDPDIAQFAVATPYPGSEMYQILKKENKIVSSNWDDYDSFAPGGKLFVHENLDSATIYKKLREAYKSFYFRPKYILKQAKSMIDYREFFKSIKKIIHLLKILRHKNR